MRPGKCSAAAAFHSIKTGAFPSLQSLFTIASVFTCFVKSATARWSYAILPAASASRCKVRADASDSPTANVGNDAGRISDAAI